MKTDDLISTLSNELKPVTPWAAPAKMALKYTLFGFVLVALGLLLSGPRHDFSVKSLQFHFWLGISLWTAFSFLGLSLAFNLATPGRKVSPGLAVIFCLNFAGILLWHFLRLMGMNTAGLLEGLALDGSRCALATTATAVVLGAGVLYRLKRGASRRPGLSTVLIGLAGLAIGGVLITLNCGDDNGMHVVMWHFVIPGIITSLIAAAFMGRLLRW
ncbi:NrsF family protein [Bdellovibrio svalbardensis]|uniref:DUF1109 domain-containing protein n=1 Tax=Bdellovibrio svalbardensis TaxID=2972972 RepID=A0ABT6DGQ4_9BACT|nr:NrsF family protein [Bdellovibrio svalbardensis]MDG0815997.1 DUF1109 domain-containing protein [Bdellovibrio svalbardensis]